MEFFGSQDPDGDGDCSNDNDHETLFNGSKREYKGHLFTNLKVFVCYGFQFRSSELTKHNTQYVGVNKIKFWQGKNETRRESVNGHRFLMPHLSRTRRGDKTVEMGNGPEGGKALSSHHIWMFTPSVCLPVRPSARPSLRPSVPPSIPPSIHP
jgi:hypothetical protein